MGTAAGIERRATEEITDRQRARFGDRMSQNTRLQIPRAPGWISELFT
jgi:hypothetical protein